MTFKRKTQINPIDAEADKYERTIARLSFSDAEAAKLRALAVAIRGEDYVRNIENIAIENAAAETYTPQGYQDTRRPAPFLIDLLFAFDPDGEVGRRRPNSRACLLGWTVASPRQQPEPAPVASSSAIAQRDQQSPLEQRPPERQQQHPAKQAADAPQSRGMSVDQAAAYIGIHRATLYKLSKEGLIKARKICGKTIFLRDEVEGYLEGLPRAFAGAGDGK